MDADNSLYENLENYLLPLFVFYFVFVLLISLVLREFCTRI